MNILGIDPGTGRTGWGIIRIESEKSKIKHNPHVSKNKKKKETDHKDSSILGNGIEYIAHGCIVTDPREQMPKRLMVLEKELVKIFSEFRPDCVIVEQIFFGKNTKTAMSVGQARGVVMLCAAKAGLEVFEYTSSAVKHFLSGDGRLDKKNVQKIVRRLLGKDKRKLAFSARDRAFDDSADALAIAIYHATREITQS